MIGKIVLMLFLLISVIIVAGCVNTTPDHNWSQPLATPIPTVSSQPQHQTPEIITINRQINNTIYVKPPTLTDEHRPENGIPLENLTQYRKDHPMPTLSPTPTPTPEPTIFRIR